MVGTTRYFSEQVLNKRPYLSEQQCRQVIADPLARADQADGRIRFWGAIVLPNEAEERILRVITLDDGETIHNAFIDRNFRKDMP